MPTVRHPAILRAVYQETARRLTAREMLTELIEPSRSLYRNFDLKYLKINAKGMFPRQEANQALVIRNQHLDEHRFTGQSFHRDIPASGGLYCSLQHTAQISELQHYARADKGIPRNPKTGFPASDSALARKCIVKIRMMGSVLAADLSPHNPMARQFIEEIGATAAVQRAIADAGLPFRSLWEQLCDSTDCSVARGIGLAIASSGYLLALQAASVRPFEADLDHAGDNLIFFGKDQQPLRNLWVEEAYMFPLHGPPQLIPIA